MEHQFKNIELLPSQVGSLISGYLEQMLDLHRENIRLQCEQQIKGKLIRLRQAYLEIGLKKKGIESLLKESLNALIPIFRNILRLKGKRLPVDKEKVLMEISKELRLDKDVFLSIWRDKKNDERIGGRDVEDVFAKYIEEMRKLALAVDELPTR